MRAYRTVRKKSRKTKKRSAVPASVSSQRNVLGASIAKRHPGFSERQASVILTPWRIQ
jgi:hypothetical protein